MKWDTIAFKFTFRRDDVDSAFIESVPGKDDEGPNSLWKRYFRFTGPGRPHADLLEVLREDGWAPFAIERGTEADDIKWTERWFKRPSEPTLPPVPTDWDPNDDE